MSTKPDHGLDDTGARTTFDTGAQRELAPGKGRFDLLPGIAMAKVMEHAGGRAMDPHVTFLLARHYENGAKKYSARNWEKGLPLWSFLDSGLRHLYKEVDGKTDEDHLIAALWNLICYVDTECAIAKGTMPASLREPPIRTQERWGDEFKNVDISKAKVEGVIRSVHIGTGTGDMDYILDAIVELEGVIVNRSLIAPEPPVVPGPNLLPKFKVGDVVDVVGEIGLWRVTGRKSDAYKIRKGNRKRTTYERLMTLWKSKSTRTYK